MTPFAGQIYSRNMLAVYKWSTVGSLVCFQSEKMRRSILPSTLAFENLQNFETFPLLSELNLFSLKSYSRLSEIFFQWLCLLTQPAEVDFVLLRWMLSCWSKVLRQVPKATFASLVAILPFWVHLSFLISRVDKVGSVSKFLLLEVMIGSLTGFPVNNTPTIVRKKMYLLQKELTTTNNSFLKCAEIIASTFLIWWF